MHPLIKHRLQGKEKKPAKVEDIINPPNLGPPTTPTGVTITPFSLAVVLTWNKNPETDIGSYQLQRADDANFTTGVISPIINGTAYVDKTQDTVTRFYRISAVRTSGAMSPFTAAVPGAGLLLGNAQLNDAAVTTAKLANLAVDNAKLANLAVDAAKLANLAVDNAKLANLAVDNAKLANLAVDNAKLADSAVTATKIANLAVGSAAIAAVAIGTGHIADAAILTAKIGDGQITAAKIGTAQINSAHIGDGQITAAKIGTAQINSAHIGDLQVTDAKISNLTISTGKIINFAVNVVGTFINDVSVTNLSATVWTSVASVTLTPDNTSFPVKISGRIILNGAGSTLTADIRLKNSTDNLVLAVLLGVSIPTGDSDPYSIAADDFPTVVAKTWDIEVKLISTNPSVAAKNRRLAVQQSKK